MDDKIINELFNLLDNFYKANKKNKNQKEDSKKNFLQKLKNAKKNIYLLGLKFPSYITSPEHKIHKALKELDESNAKIDIYIYKPTLSIINEIDKLNVYKEKYHTRDICKIDTYKNDFKNLNIKVISYNKLIKIGLSAIDLGEDKEFLHISQVKENEEIKNAEYYEFESNLENKRIFQLMIKLLRNIKEE